MFYCCLLLFFSTRDLRGPWADLREICTHVWKHVQFINAGLKIWKSALPLPRKKILGIKNTLNLAQFQTPSYFEHEYLRKG